jgi:multidrug efflux pump subunit AcrA (membrane-fusion protein)
MKSQKFILVFSLWSLVFGLTGCQAKVEKTKEQEVIPVRVFRVAAQELSETLEYVGNIKASDEAIVYPKVSGKIIEKVKEDGAPINKGEVIAYIDRDEVGLKFEKAPVESPLSGIVGRFYVDIGQNVDTQTPVALVVNMDQVKIDLDIPEKYLPQVSLGQEAKVKVDAYPHEDSSGTVTKISPVVNLENRAAPVKITVDNPAHRLKSGMFAKVNLIIAEHKDVAVILKEAILGKEPNLYVYVVENNKALLRKISLGIRQGPYYEVRTGLEAGESVVIMGQQRLYDGAQVVAEE